MRPAEGYFERDEDGIRLKGHRIWLENILDLYKAGLSPEQIRDEDHLRQHSIVMRSRPLSSTTMRIRAT